MREFTANRLSGGNKIFPAEIKIDNFGVTLKIPGVFSGNEKSLGFHQISSVKIDSPLIGFSKITFDTIGWDRIVAEGFEKSDADEIKHLVQQGISSSRGGNIHNNQNPTSNQVIIQQQPKTADQILAEAEAEKIKHQIEMEKKAKQEQENKEFWQGVKKHWKIWVSILILSFCIIAFMGYRENNKKQKDIKLSQQLETIEDNVKLAIQSGDKEKALELANQLVHPSHENMENKDFDSWNGYPKYDEYWTKKREEYKKQIINPSSTTEIPKEENLEITTNEQPTKSQIEEPINEISNTGKAIATSDIANFYTEPDIQTKRKAFVVKGQEVTYEEISGEFIKASFTNEKGTITTGWMLKSDFKL